MFSEILRTFMLLYFNGKLNLTAIVIGLKFDIIIASIIGSVLLLTSFALSFLKLKNENKILIAIYFIFLITQLFFTIIDFSLMEKWEYIFNFRAIKYIYHPVEVINNFTSFQIVFSVLLMTSISFSFIMIIHKMKATHFFSRCTLKSKLFFFPIVIAGTILISRGGIREIPINQSDAFFSNDRIINLCTINSTWNFFNTIFEYDKYKGENQYKLLDYDRAKTIVDSVHSFNSVGKIEILDPSVINPNILIITMEGVCASILRDSSLFHYMPFLNSLKKESYIFTKAYSVGFRTEQGISAMLSGTYSTPFHNSTDNVSSSYKLPSILTSAINKGYSTKFIFGGNIEFANIKVYLKEIGFQYLIEINDFDDDKKTQKLGVPDNLLFNKCIEEIKKMDSPYFIQILTQSTHEPYDIPKQVNTNDKNEKFKNSAQFLDNSIRDFFFKLKRNHFLKNTLIIITSDHSHQLPGGNHIDNINRYYIPLFFYGDVLNQNIRGKTNDSLFRQNNFPATFSHILGWKQKNYLNYSISHFSDCPKFSYSNFVNGIIYSDNNHELFYFFHRNKNISQDTIEKYKVPFSILQKVSEDMLD